MSVPSFTSLSEVVNHLNATGPDANSKYTVYGLTISATSAQAHVDHANKYIYSLVPRLVDPTDSRYVSAQLAALDIACLGVLITVVGGSLIGAVNYSLSDMNITRGGQFATAIKIAIDAYQQSVIGKITNLSAVVTLANSSRDIPHYAGPELSP